MIIEQKFIIYYFVWFDSVKKCIYFMRKGIYNYQMEKLAAICTMFRKLFPPPGKNTVLPVKFQ